VIVLERRGSVPGLPLKANIGEKNGPKKYREMKQIHTKNALDVLFVAHLDSGAN